MGRGGEGGTMKPVCMTLSHSPPPSLLFFILPSASQRLPSHPAWLALKCAWRGGVRGCAPIRLLFALSPAFVARGEPTSALTHTDATDQGLVSKPSIPSHLHLHSRDTRDAHRGC